MKKEKRLVVRDKKIQMFLKVGGRKKARKIFFELVRRASKTRTH